MATQQARRDASCRAILAAAATAIAEQGVDGFTISAVSRASGLNRATIYHYFPTRADLVASALRHTLAAQAAPEQGAGRATVAERLRAYVQSPELARFLVSLLQNGEPLPRLPRVASAVEQIRRGQQAGVMRDEVDAELFVAVMWMAEMTWAVGRTSIAASLGIPVEEADARIAKELGRIASEVVRRPAPERAAGHG